LENGFQKICGGFEVEVPVMYAGNTSPLLLSETAEIQDSSKMTKFHVVCFERDNIVCIQHNIHAISHRNTADCSANHALLSPKLLFLLFSRASGMIWRARN